MAAQKGTDIVVSVTDDEMSPTAQAFTGIRNATIQINSETVDITNSGSTGQWRELLAGAGVRSVTISGNGVFVDETAEAEARDMIMEHEHRHVDFLVPDFGTFDGLFQLTSLEFAGEYNGEVTFAMTWESAGEVTFTAA